MASLIETMQNNVKAQAGTGGPAKRLVRGPDGQLQEVTGQEVQGLSAAAGIPAPPTTPAGVAGIGGSPDQSKMAGTPAQKGAALDIATGGQSQADYLRKQQAPTQMSQQQSQVATKGQQLQNLSSLADKAQSLIQANLQKATAAVGPAQLSGQVDKNSATYKSLTDPKNQKQLEVDLATATDPLKSEQEKMEALAHASRMTNTTITKDNVGTLFKSEGAYAAGQAAGAGGEVNVGTLLSQGQLGYSAQELGSLLGVDPAKLQGYSVQQLEDAVSAEQNKEFQSVEKSRIALRDPATGPAERAEAAKALGAAGQSGLAAVEQNMGDLTQSIQNAETITVGGKEMSIDDFLKDEHFSAIVKDAIENPSSLEAIRKDDPTLAKFIDKYHDTFQAATKNIQATATNLGDLQKTRANAYSGVSPALAKAEGFEPGKISATPVKPSAVVQLMKQDQGKMEAVNSLVSAFPEAASWLGQLSPEDLKQMDIGGSDWKERVAQITQAKQIASANPADPTSVYQAIAPGAKPADIQSTLDKQKTSSAVLGTPYSSSLFDSDGDGKMDDPTTLQKNATARVGGTVKDILTKKTPVGHLDPVPQAQVETNPGKQKLVDKLGPSAADGVIDSGDILKSGLDIDDLWTAKDNGYKGAYDSGAKTTIESQIKKFQDQAATDVIARENASGRSPDEQIQMMQQELDNNKDGKKLNRQTLLDRMEQLHLQGRAPDTGVDAVNNPLAQHIDPKDVAAATKEAEENQSGIANTGVNIDSSGMLGDSNIPQPISAEAARAKTTGFDESLLGRLKKSSRNVRA